MSDPAPQPERRPPVGLALSGGGFRAAFFHVGVLARLAETGTLRKVEVISTVSGGSILGALYYLALKDLLENVPDSEITDAHYIQVVQRVEKALFDGVGKHVRGLIYANLGKNFRMRRNDYSRSDRLGELYDEIFYRPAWEKPLFGSASAPRTFEGAIRMRELLVHPPGAPDGFKPRRHNGDRRAPVPVLLLNATSLNTGHNWRFQASEMGEDPRDREEWVQIDKNMRLLSRRYEEIAECQHDFELGHAVAASACVPALFHPLAVSKLFPNDVRVQLVDGGVHDNQGVCGLFDTQSERLIVSDASGQMGDLAEPSTRIPAAAGRSSSIYGDRVREEQLIESLARHETVLMHLRKGLPARGISPLGVNDEPLAPDTELGQIDYGVAPQAQAALSRVRTDLDSFSEVEAYGLSLYGHRMASRELPEPATASYEWQLEGGAAEKLGSALASPGPALEKQLAVASKRFMKASALDGRVRAVSAAAGLLVLAALGYAGYLLYEPATGDVPAWTLIVAVVLPGVLVGLYMKQKFRIKAFYRFADWLYTWLVPVLLAAPLWVGAKVILLTNGAFLAAGRIDRVTDES